MNTTGTQQRAPSLRQRAEGEMTGRERFEPDTHRSDETARRLRLVHEDRQVINVSGFSVDPTAVEEVLNRHPKVARAAVIGVPDAGTGEAVKAFIVLTEGGSAEQILGWMSDPATGMASYLVPKHIEFRRSLPVTIEGTSTAHSCADHLRWIRCSFLVTAYVQREEGNP